MFGTNGNIVFICIFFAILVYFFLSAKKISDVHWIGVIILAFMVGGIFGSISTIFLDETPKGSSSKCIHWDWRGRGLECVEYRSKR